MNRTGLIALVFCFVSLLAGCASGPSSGDMRDIPTSSDQTDYQKRSRIRMQLAVGYYEQREFGVALDEIKQAIQADPSFADAYSVRALIYMELGELRLAEENMLHALKLAPNNPDFSNNYGWFLCQNGRPKESIAYFESAMKNRVYQSPSKAMNNAGVCSLKLKDDAAAERYLTDAFRFEPDNPVVNVNLAKVYYGRNDYARARFYSNRAVKADAPTAEALWMAIRVEHKLGDRTAESSLATQLRRRYPRSEEYAAYQRGAYDE